MSAALSMYHTVPWRHTVCLEVTGSTVSCQRAAEREWSSGSPTPSPSPPLPSDSDKWSGLMLSWAWWAHTSPCNLFQTNTNLSPLNTAISFTKQACSSVRSGLLAFLLLFVRENEFWLYFLMEAPHQKWSMNCVVINFTAKLSWFSFYIRDEGDS